MSLAWMYSCNIFTRSRVLCNNSLKRTCHRCSFDLHYTYSLCWSDHGVDCLVGPLLAPSLLVTGALRTSLMVVGFVSRHCWYCCPCGVSEPFTVPTLVRGYTYNHMESTKKLIKIKKYMLVHWAKSSLLKQIRRTAHCVIESLIALDG